MITRSTQRLLLVLVTMFIVGLVGLGGVIAYAKARIDDESAGRVFTATEALPSKKTGLVLGCSPSLADGRENLFFRYRMDAAEALFKSGKVDFLIVSGDNSRIGYDEPTAMKADLVRRGVPAERIHRDYAGFSTLDSMVRAKAVFQEDALIVISQDFHVRRAIYIGQAHAMEAYGFAARGVEGRLGVRTQLREALARVKAVLDVTVLDRQPRYLGDPITVVEKPPLAGHENSH
jgi:SanA protein